MKTTPATIDEIKLIGLDLGRTTTNKNNQSSIDGGNLWQKFKKRGYRFDFEIYDERSHNWNDAEIDIYLS
jgi:predicted transcriptional regulator YdeE